MARRNRRRAGEVTSARPSASTGERREHWRGELYVVRGVTGAGAVKTYRCPGCDQELRPGLPHVVTWPAHEEDAGGRRHWHSPCWAARGTRAPGIQRGRGAPRY